MLNLTRDLRRDPHLVRTISVITEGRYQGSRLMVAGEYALSQTGPGLTAEPRHGQWPAAGHGGTGAGCGRQWDRARDCRLVAKGDRALERSWSGHGRARAVGAAVTVQDSNRGRALLGLTAAVAQVVRGKKR